MAEFLTFDEGETNAGPGRLALTDTANAVADDPTDMADIVDASYVFQDPYGDLGTTEGGITITSGYDAQAYQVDLSDGDFGMTPHNHHLLVETNLAQIANLAAFKQAWAMDGAITQVLVSLEQILPLGASKQLIYRSMVIVTPWWQDSGSPMKMRAFYLRKVANVAGDSAHALSVSALQLLPLHLQAFKDTTAGNGRLFGFIMQQNGWGGVTLP